MTKNNKDQNQQIKASLEALQKSNEAIKRLLIIQLLAQGVDASVIAKSLGYKRVSSITNVISVRDIKPKNG